MAKDPRVSACEIAAADVEAALRALDAGDIEGAKNALRCLPTCLRAAARGDEPTYHERTGDGKRGVRCYGCGKRPGAGNVRCDPCAVKFVRDWKASPEDNRRAAERIGKMLPRW